MRSKKETEIGRNAIASYLTADKFDFNYLPDAVPEKPIKRLTTKGLTECCQMPETLVRVQGLVTKKREQLEIKF